VRGGAVFGSVKGVGEGVVLRLQADLNDFHGVYDGDGFRYTCGETGCSLLVSIRLHLREV
jgi:hypothetical protein